MKKLLVASAALTVALILAPGLKAQTIAAWSFENDSIATNNNPATSTGAGSADSIGMNVYATPNVGVTQDDIDQGATGDTGANTIADLTHTWRIRGQAGTNGAANGWSSLAPIASQGAQFFASTAGYSNSSYNTLLISFDWYATTQGEANLELMYTDNDGSTWTNLPITLGAGDSAAQILNGTDSNTTSGSYISDNKLNNSSAGQDWFTDLTAAISDPAAFNNSEFGIEMVNASTGADCVSTQGTALNNNSGNWRFDNVSIQAVPEPSTYAIVAAGAFLLIAGSRRFRGSFRKA